MKKLSIAVLVIVCILSGCKPAKSALSPGELVSELAALTVQDDSDALLTFFHDTVEYNSPDTYLLAETKNEMKSFIESVFIPAYTNTSVYKTGCYTISTNTDYLIIYGGDKSQSFNLFATTNDLRIFRIDSY